MLLVGAGVGLISTALGLGGGILMVPVFQVVPGMDAHTAKGTSLFIIIFVSAINILRLGKRGERRPWDVAVSIGAGSIVGGYLGAWVTSFMSETAVNWIFVAVVAVLAVRLLASASNPTRETPVRHRMVVGTLIGLLTGLIAGMTGIGGGNIMVPLVLIAGIMRNEHVVLLSNMVMVATSAASTVAHLAADQTYTTDLPIGQFTYGQVNVAMAPLIIVGAQLVVPLGKRINAYLTPVRRRYAMAGLLAFIAIQQALQAMW
jgi:uncharacterized membrane protein YfcA